VAVNFLAGPRALVRERDHQERREHTLNGYGLIQIKPEGERARRGAADRSQGGEVAGAVRRAALGPDWSRKLPRVQCGFGLGIGTAA